MRSFPAHQNLIYLQGTINKAASLATGRPCTRRIKLMSSNDPLISMDGIARLQSSTLLRNMFLFRGISYAMRKPARFN